MAIETNSKVTWEDVVAIYSQLNKEATTTSGKKTGGRPAFGFSVVSVPERKDKTVLQSDLALLNTFIAEMKSNSYLKNLPLGVTLPNRGDLLQPSFLSTLQSQITTVNSTCAFNSSYHGSCFGQGGGGSGNESCFARKSSSYGSNGSCYGACWGSCFSDRGDVGCNNHRCDSRYGTCRNDGCTWFGCSERRRRS